MRAFIICNGPSLNDIDLSLMKDDVTFAMNDGRLFFDKLTPTYWCIDDVHYFKKYYREIFKGATEGIKVLLPANIRILNQYLGVPVPSGIEHHHILMPSINDISKHIEFDEMKFNVQPFGVYTAATVTYSVIQRAFQKGYTELYMVGCDAEEPRPAINEKHHHFDPAYSERVTHRPVRTIDKEMWRKAYRKAIEVIEENGGSIKIANGKNTIFERVEYGSLFNGDS